MLGHTCSAPFWPYLTGWEGESLHAATVSLHCWQSFSLSLCYSRVDSMASPSLKFRSLQILTIINPDASCMQTLESHKSSSINIKHSKRLMFLFEFYLSSVSHGVSCSTTVSHGWHSVIYLVCLWLPANCWVILLFMLVRQSFLLHKGTLKLWMQTCSWTVGCLICKAVTEKDICF